MDISIKSRAGLILAMWLVVLVQRANAAEEAGHEIFRKVVQGHVAFCRSTEVDELQVIGQPRQLTPAEADKLAAFLGAEDTWYERRADGQFWSANSFCLPVWDFKFQLSGYSGKPVISIRLCSTCRQVAAMADYRWLELPNLRQEMVEELYRMLDGWFPDWRNRTKQNRQEWSRRARPEERKKPAAKESGKPATVPAQNRP